MSRTTDPDYAERWAARDNAGSNLAIETALWRSPSAQEPGISADRLEGEIGSRMYDKKTGRLAQYGIEQQAAKWPTPDASMSSGGRQSAEPMATVRPSGTKKAITLNDAAQSGVWDD